MKKGIIFKFIKRSFVVLLCAVLLFVCVISSSSYKVKAAVPLVAIGVAAIASFLGAAGISLTTSNMTKDSFTDSIYDMANEYSESSNVISLEDALKTKDALNYYYNSKIGDAVVSFGDTFTGWLNGFKSWFVSKFALTDSGETTILSDQYIEFGSGKYLYYNTYRDVFDANNKPISSVPLAPGDIKIVELDDNLSIRFAMWNPEYISNHWTVTVEVSINGNNVHSDWTHRYSYDLNDPTSASRIKVLFSNTNHTSPKGKLNIVVMPLDNGSYADGYTIYTNILLRNYGIADIGLSGSLTDGYSDFEQALSDARTDAGVNGQVAVDVGDVAVEKPYTDEAIANGILDNVITNVGTGTLVGGYADEKEVEEETDTERVPTVAEIGEGIVIVDGLEDFFPFCIPFDLIALIDKFNVAPEAPVIHWNMSFAGLFSDEELVLDFSGWETAAMIFRICCLIGFCIFLILKTRDMIRG